VRLIRVVVWNFKPINESTISLLTKNEVFVSIAYFLKQSSNRFFVWVKNTLDFCYFFVMLKFKRGKNEKVNSVYVGVS